MKNYMKPTFMIASLGITALAANSCDYNITAEDKEFLNLWSPGWETSGFHSSETDCTIKIDMYCKYTSGDDTSLNVSNAFSS